MMSPKSEYCHQHGYTAWDCTSLRGIVWNLCEKDSTNGRSDDIFAWKYTKYNFLYSTCNLINTKNDSNRCLWNKGLSKK